MKKIKQIINSIRSFVKKLFFHKPAVNKTGIALVIVALILGLAYYFKGLFLAAVVNGQPITRLSVIKVIEKRDGKQALENIVTETLIKQEGVKMKIAVTPAEIDTEVKKISDQLQTSGQDMTSLLALQGMTIDDFKKQIMLQKTVEKILSDKIGVTEDEVSKYIEANKTTFPATYSQDEIKTAVQEQLKQEKLSTEFQKWLDIAKTKSSINYFINY